MDEEKPKHNYIFGDLLGNLLAKVDLRTQYEAGIMSSTLMIVGMIVTLIYGFIYIKLVLWYKIMIVINVIAGIVFLWSSLVTQFQSYRNYMEIKDFQEQQMKGGK